MKNLKLKIGIDISQVVYGTGTSQYSKNLLQALLQVDAKNDYVLFGGALRRMGDLRSVSHRFTGNYTTKLYPFSPLMLDLLWNRMHLFPIENFTGPIDVFHSSDWAQPPRRQAKMVTTIHDLGPLLYPGSFRPKVVEAHKRRLTWVVKEADGVIAVSWATKKDIIKYLGIPEKKIYIIYEAPNPIFKPTGERLVGELRRKYQLPKMYVLAVGTDPRKNIARIAQAVSKIDGAPPLVVVGRKWGKSVLSEAEWSHHILWLGYVDDMTLRVLYSGAGVLVYASLYEGFGLPILEAMACGCPVITSNRSAMPEIAGEAAVLVNPEDVDDITRGINKALTTRSDLVKKGLVRAKQFSWEKAARQTLEVYRQVAQ